MLTDTEELEAAWNALAGQKSETGFFRLHWVIQQPRFRGGVLFPDASEVLLVGFNVEIVPPKANCPKGVGFRVEIVKRRRYRASKCGVCLVRHAEAGRDFSCRWLLT